MEWGGLFGLIVPRGIKNEPLLRIIESVIQIEKSFMNLVNPSQI